MTHWLAVFCLALAVTGCGDAGSAALVDTGAIYLDECTAFSDTCDSSSGEHCGTCQYRIQYRSDVCTKQSPCANVFLLWAAMGCESDGIAASLAALVQDHPDFVAVCMQPIYPGEVLPISLGAPERENVLVAHVFDRLGARGDVGVWTGDNLLMGGCSMGATRYPVIAARYTDDNKWVGRTKTAVCMSDGVVDLTYQDNAIGTSTGQSCESRHRRIAAAYTRDTPVTGHSCQDSPQAQCACDPNHSFRTHAGDCNGADCVAFDTIVHDSGGQDSGSSWQFSDGVSASSFAAPHWKLITEGGSWAGTTDACMKDVVAGAPYKELCSLLDADDAKSCTYQAFPARPHCSYYTKNIGTLCIDWFVGL